MLFLLFPNKLLNNFVCLQDINRKQSLFRQHVSTLKPTKDIAKIQKDEFLHSNKEEVSFVAEDQLADKIHQENLDKLAKMSEAEILKEKKILEETLDSKIIQFLKNRKKCGKRSIEESMNTTLSTNSVASLDTESSDKKLKLSSNDNDTEIENDTNISITKEITMDVEVPDDKKTKFPLKGDDTNMDWEDDTVSIPKSSKEILEASKQKGWLHMDKPEPEKLKWMKELTEEKEELATNEEYNARFDFNG